MFRWAEVRTFCHATEDPAKVERALRLLAGDAELRRTALEGHHGNPILLLVARLERAADVREFWGRVAGKAQAAAWLERLEDRVDEGGVFHVRFDKQQAALGVVAPPSGEDVLDARLKVQTFPARREAAVAALRQELDRIAADG